MLSQVILDRETGRVDLDLWAEAVAVKRAVGSCRDCGGPLLAEEPDTCTITRLTFLPARCVLCGETFQQPAGRIVAAR